jgi:hypothetical protein
MDPSGFSKSNNNHGRIQYQAIDASKSSSEQATLTEWEGTEAEVGRNDRAVIMNNEAVGRDKEVAGDNGEESAHEDEETIERLKRSAAHNTHAP